MLNNLIHHLSCEIQETYGKDEWNLYILVGLQSLGRKNLCLLSFQNKLCGWNDLNAHYIPPFYSSLSFHYPREWKWKFDISMHRHVFEWSVKYRAALTICILIKLCVQNIFYTCMLNKPREVGELTKTKFLL